MDEASIFLEALKNPSPDERAAFLDRVCGGDDELRRSVELLLRAHDKVGGFLADSPAPVGVTADPPITECPGTVIGPYKLIEPIGEGGMGTVWMAQQTEPVKRLVAVKLIKAGMDSRQVIARFEAERQALALMDHPNIARVLDAGATTAGRPYFVMDLVKGAPITHYCDEHCLTPRQRLQLFLPVCQAVQHAHQKGIIHRDLKPSNVLVALYDGRPVPKVIDFGVAKAAGKALTDKTLITGFGNIVGTLEYMSPEQAEINQLDIDTRSDIYSLGVLLYELLTGSTPFSKKGLEKAGMLEMLRVIREQEPSKPSTKLSTAEGLPTLAANRGTEPAKLTKLVRGELDWIVMKALEKDRSRRYETANGFAMDVQRYLADEPVQACPPSAWYRLRKFARRNKRALVTATLLGVMLLVAVGAVAGSIGWILQDRAVQATQFQYDIDLALRDGIPLKEKVADLVSKPADWKAELATRLTAVERAESLLNANAKLATPALRARVRENRADLDAEERDRRLIAGLEDLMLPQADTSGNLHPSPTTIVPKFARAFEEYGIPFPMDAKQAAHLVRQRPDAVRDFLIVGLESWIACSSGQERDWLVAVLQAADKDPWRTDVRRASARGDRVKLEELARTVDVSKQPAQSLVLLGRSLENLGSWRGALELLSRAQPHYPDDIWVNLQIAYYCGYVQPPQFNQAARYWSVAAALRPRNPELFFRLGAALNSARDCDGALAAFQRVIALKPDHARAYSGLGYVLRVKGNFPDALSAYKKAVEHQSDDAQVHCEMVHLAEKKGDLCGAIAVYQKLIARGPTAINCFGLGYALQVHGDLAGASAAYRKAIELDPQYAPPYYNLGVALGMQGKLPEAIAAYRKLLELDPNQDAARHHLARIYGNRGRALRDHRKLDEAIASFKAAIEVHPNGSWAYHELGITLRAQKKLEEAIACFRKCIKLDPSFLQAHFDLGYTLGLLGKVDEGLAVYEEVIRRQPDHAYTAHAFGCFLRDVKHDYEGAIAWLNKARKLDPDNARVLNDLGSVLHRQGKPDEAIAVYQEAIRLLPRDSWAHLSVGRILHSKGDYAGAIACFNKVLEVNPKNDQVHRELGLVLQKQGKPDEAAAAFREYERRRLRDDKSKSLELKEKK
jgi:tetratricopeptide (TPR) repeat protein